MYTPNDKAAKKFHIFVDIDKIILKSTWKVKGTRITKLILRNKTGFAHSICVYLFSLYSTERFSM